MTEPSVVAPVPRSMVWSEREACERQVTQIGTSACGATAVVNVFVSSLNLYLTKFPTDIHHWWSDDLRKSEESVDEDGKRP